MPDCQGQNHPKISWPRKKWKHPDSKPIMKIIFVRGPELCCRSRGCFKAADKTPRNRIQKGKNRRPIRHILSLRLGQPPCTYFKLCFLDKTFFFAAKSLPPARLLFVILQTPWPELRVIGGDRGSIAWRPLSARLQCQHSPNQEHRMDSVSIVDLQCKVATSKHPPRRRRKKRKNGVPYQGGPISPRCRRVFFLNCADAVPPSA